MSLLSICQNVLAETGWPVLGSIASNADGTAKQIFALANKELRATSELYQWPQLEVEYSFATVANQATYAMPADFKVMANQSLFNKSQYYALRGNSALPYWQLMKYGKLSSLARTYFKPIFLSGSPYIELTPVPTSAEDLVIVYYSNKYTRDASNVEMPLYAQDTDTSKIPERVVELGLTWRFRRAKGLDFSAELAEYNSTIAQQFAEQAALGDIPIGGRRPNDEFGLTQGYVRDYGFGS